MPEALVMFLKKTTIDVFILEGGGGVHKLINYTNSVNMIIVDICRLMIRSTYYQKIEEDCIKYRSSILEIQSALVAFKATNMTELLKFHQHVEDHLENLSDERQVLNQSFERWRVLACKFCS
jgi:hypothetical protein